MVNDEVWKDIRGYEGLYQVSNKGRVKSLMRLVKYGGKQHTVPDKMKALSVKDNEYLFVNLWKGNKAKNKYVHRLVAQAFLSDYTESLMVNHKDMNRKDNKLTNLEMVTNKYNQNHAQRFKGKKRGAYKGHKGYRAVITINGKVHHIGSYETKEEAYNAFYNKYKEIHGVAPWI